MMCECELQPNDDRWQTANESSSSYRKPEQTILRELTHGKVPDAVFVVGALFLLSFCCCCCASRSLLLPLIARTNEGSLCIGNGMNDVNFTNRLHFGYHENCLLLSTSHSETKWTTQNWLLLFLIRFCETPSLISPFHHLCWWITMLLI